MMSKLPYHRVDQHGRGVGRGRDDVVRVEARDVDLVDRPGHHLELLAERPAEHCPIPRINRAVGPEGTERERERERGGGGGSTDGGGCQRVSVSVGQHEASR